MPAGTYTAGMCGRFTIAVTVGWEDRFRAKQKGLELRPRYNVAPSQQVPIVRDDPDEPGTRAIVPMRWGLVPSWAKEAKTGYSTINARAEGLTTSPAYRGPVRHRRCLVPATGFYEWKQEGSRRLPYYIDRKDHQLFAMAGLYDIWHGPETTLASFTIVTIPANEVVSPVHDRMPAVLSRENEDRWMQQDPLSGDELARILATRPTPELEAYRVSPRVNSPTTEGPDLIEPVPAA